MTWHAVDSATQSQGVAAWGRVGVQADAYACCDRWACTAQGVLLLCKSTRLWHMPRVSLSVLLCTAWASCCLFCSDPAAGLVRARCAPAALDCCGLGCEAGVHSPHHS